MPIYEYHCESCDKKYEKLQEDSTEKFICPSCGGLAKRVIGTFYFSKDPSWMHSGGSTKLNWPPGRPGCRHYPE